MGETTNSMSTRHYKASTVWGVFGMSWGSLALGYNAAVIGTTLGEPFHVPSRVYC
jgi:hypothetical protein